MKIRTALTTVFLLLFPTLSFAGESKLSAGDTAWVLISTALVMMMTPAGLALFYGGMSRSKNLLNTIAMTFISYCIVSIVWVCIGYSLSFGKDISGLIGGFDKIFLNDIDINSLSGTIPEYVFLMFQMTFACIAVAIISGAVVDRIKFSSWIVFSVLWSIFIYTAPCHWAWGGGIFEELGALDFAGGNVVHINAGVAGLVLCLVLGKRKGYNKEPMLPSSITLTALGAGLLWFGWFGFNAGSELAANGVAASALLVTNTSAAAGAIGWLFVEWLKTGKPTLLGIASGAIAGLVAITPAAGYVGMPASLIMGFISAIIGFYGVSFLKYKLGYDDSLDAFGIHGICGIWGAIATGIFAKSGIDGSFMEIFSWHATQTYSQFLSVIITIAYSAVGTYIVIQITKLITGGLRVSEEEEIKGLDTSVHGERGFELGL
ncbi:MAG: ammonium transporter [Desulfobacterales bacterium]|nr:ammonium transporter [Desulfobacterales bacterium]